MIIPILPFAAPRFGASTLDIALIVVVYSVFGALVSPLWGRLSDRWGRKKTLLVCLAGSALCSLLLAFVANGPLLNFYGFVPVALGGLGNNRGSIVGGFAFGLLLRLRRRLVPERS